MAITPTSATRLALWIRSRAAQRRFRIDHLKLQKLCFYCYGGALAYGLESHIGTVLFEPWKHGPVNRDVWQTYRRSGSAELSPPTKPVPPYSPALESVLGDVVEVYGRLSSWGIRCESHLEEPWISAWRARSATIPNSQIRNHFVRKFTGPVQLPVYLGGAANAAVDGIPAARFDTLHDLAHALRAADLR